MNVKIYKPSKNAMQSGRNQIKGWVLEHDTLIQNAPEPLMGWVSADNTLGQIKLNFPTLEEATAFADKKGWDYTILPEHERKLKPRNYGDNFKYIPPAPQEKA